MRAKGSSLGTAEYPGTAASACEAPVQDAAVRDAAIGEIESALHSLSRSLRQVRLHDFLRAEARADVDRAGMALLYVLHVNGTSLRLTELAEQLHIDAPAVTRKAQQLERSGLVGRTRDTADGRATRLRLTAAGRQTISRILAARRAWLTGLLSGWPGQVG